MASLFGSLLAYFLASRFSFHVASFGEKVIHTEKVFMGEIPAWASVGQVSDDDIRGDAAIANSKVRSQVPVAYPSPE